MGPLGAARWSFIACQEVIRRNNDLCVLLNERKARYKGLLTLLAGAEQEAKASVERVEMIRQELNKKRAEASKGRKDLAARTTWANKQREKMASQTGQTGGVGMSGARVSALMPKPASSRYGGLTSRGASMVGKNVATPTKRSPTHSGPDGTMGVEERT